MVDIHKNKKFDISSYSKISQLNTRTNNTTKSSNDNEIANSIFSETTNRNSTISSAMLPVDSSGRIANMSYTLKKYSEDHTEKETYDYLINYLKENKNDSKYIQSTISNLLNNFASHYDDDVNIGKIADSKEEILITFITTPYKEKINNAVCSTIHGLARDILNDVGIPAVLLSSQSVNEAHATLLYKINDHEYIHNNYDKSNIIEADNIKGAVKEIFKSDTQINGERGYIFISGKDGRSYEEFLFQDESVYGKDIEKSSHIKETAFLGDNVKTKNTINANASYSNNAEIKNIEAEGTIAIPDKNVSVDIGIATKRNGETDLAIKSSSVGGKIDASYRKDFGENNNQSIKTNVGIKVTNIDVNAVNNNYNTLMLKDNVDVSYENKFFENENLSLKAGAKTSLIHSTATLTHDLRLSTEAGIAMKNQLGSVGSIDTELNVGIVGDFTKTSYAGRQYGLTPGIKTNIKTALTLSPTQNGFGKIEAEGYYLKTNTVEHYGASAGVSGAYKFSNNIEGFGGINFNYNHKNIDIGLFKESIDDDMNINSVIGAKISDDATIGLQISEDLKKKDFYAGLTIKKEF